MGLAQHADLPIFVVEFAILGAYRNDLEHSWIPVSLESPPGIGMRLIGLSNSLGNAEEKGIAWAQESYTMPMTKMLVVVLSVGIGAQTGWNLGAKSGVLSGFLLANLGFAIGWYFGRRFVRDVLED